ncbi:MAG TPA: DUF1016 N-terminal domain-containing protein [Opitutaceae bacterium]|nr:DUF1016 N-terminal domain-containing protein [Opitutaceae bacterium]
MAKTRRPALVTTDAPDPADYLVWLGELKQRIVVARVSAARRVNAELIHLYWDLGRSIVEKQRALGWGESVVEQVATDLQQASPGTRGFSARNIWDMRRLYETYTAEGILSQAVREMGRAGASSILPQPVAKLTESQGIAFLQQLVAEVPWGHHRSRCRHEIGSAQSGRTGTSERMTSRHRRETCGVTRLNVSTP